MWLFKAVTGTDYEVGYFDPATHAWKTPYSGYMKMKQAEAMVHYLNGGSSSHGPVVTQLGHIVDNLERIANKLP